MFRTRYGSPAECPQNKIHMEKSAPYANFAVNLLRVLLHEKSAEKSAAIGIQIVITLDLMGFFIYNYSHLHCFLV